MSEIGLALDGGGPVVGATAPSPESGRDPFTLPRGVTTAFLAVAGLLVWYVCSAVFFPNGDTLPKPTSVVPRDR